MERLEVIITTLCSIAGTVIGFLVPYLSQLKRRREERARRCFIGVVGKLPSCLYPYADFTDFHKAYNSGYKVCVIHYQTIGQAYPRSDYVIANAADDPKIINPSDEERILAVLPTD